MLLVIWSRQNNMYKIVFEKNVIKFLDKHKKENFIRLLYDKLKTLATSPYNNNLDIKAIKWEKDTYRLRIWKYRFLYEINDKEVIIFIFKADSRWSIYKN